LIDTYNYIPNLQETCFFFLKKKKKRKEKKKRKRFIRIILFKHMITCVFTGMIIALLIILLSFVPAWNVIGRVNPRELDVVQIFFLRFNVRHNENKIKRNHSQYLIK
jgi:polyferredoxin